MDCKAKPATLRLEPAGNDALWQALEAMPLGAEDRPPGFVRRLARENGWPVDRARQAILEYKRFVYLAVRAPHPVTPSRDVDQVWHLHLTHSRSYWQEMCGEILGRPLHHEPTAGGESEDRKYLEQYKRTLASYERAFGEVPPEAFWPLPQARFAGAGDLLWIDRSDYWLLPRSARALAGGAALGGIGLVALAGTGHAEGGEGTSASGWMWLMVAVVVLGLAASLVRDLAGRPRKRRRRGSDSSPGWFGGCGSSSDDCGGSSDGCGGGGCGS